MTHTPELLLPAGSPDKLHSALLYGADAVYLGGQELNLRAGAEGFDAPGLALAVREAEAAGAKVYYCLNSLPTQAELALVPPEIEKAALAGVHAFIVADPGVLRLAKKYAPAMPVHLSTQANTTNAEGVAFWLDQGVARLNLARELCRDEIAQIRSALPAAELEVFVHGAMCLAVSGQCLLSAWLNRRSANAGRCTQPCRFDYRGVRALVVEEALREDEEIWRVLQGEKYSSLWAPEDLCLLPFLPWFTASGIRSIKVEGRNKSASYAAHAADAYRSALDTLDAQKNFDPAPFMRELMHVASRPFCTGFFLPGERNIWPKPKDFSAHTVVARILDQSAPEEWLMEIRANWPGEAGVELMLPGLKRPLLQQYELVNHRGEKAASLPNGTKATLLCAEPGIKPGIFLRLAARQAPADL